MKLLASALTLVAAFAPFTSAGQPLSSQGIRRVLSSARRLEDDRGQQGEQAVEDYIHGYSLQFLQCVSDEAIKDVDEDANDDASSQYGVIFFRLCPNDYCSNSGECKDGYADFAISIASYVQAYLEDQADNMQWDDQMDMDNFGSCNQYQQEGGNGQAYYVGPTCTNDGSDIRLGLFKDYECMSEADTEFENISNGMSLPFSDGGLISTSCLACAGYDGDGNYEVKDICMDLYDLAPLKCESWEMMHYYWDAMTEIYRYGQDTTGCKKIELLTREPATPVSEVGSFIMLFLLVAISVGGGYYYTIWWKQKKETLERIDSDEEEEHEYHQQEDSPTSQQQPEGSFA